MGEALIFREVLKVSKSTSKLFCPREVSDDEGDSVAFRTLVSTIEEFLSLSGGSPVELFFN